MRRLQLPVQEDVANTVDRLEERRKVKGQAYYERKKSARKLLVDAKKSANIDSKTKEQLEEYGY